MLLGQSAGECFKFYGFYKRQRLWDAPLDSTHPTTN